MFGRRSILLLIAAISLVSPLSFAHAASAPGAIDSPSQESRIDPGLAARDVFQTQEYWWKRIEPAPDVSNSWKGSISWFEPAISSMYRSIKRSLRSIRDWILSLLKSLFGAFGGATSRGTIWVWLIVVAILAWTAWKLFPAIVRWLSERRPAMGPRQETAWQTLPEASDLFEQANRAYRESQHAEAIRLALLALIAKLEKQGLLRYDHTRTNREYQAELRQRSEFAGPFGEVARIYERVWYGREAAVATEAEQAMRVSAFVIHGKDAAPD